MATQTRHRAAQQFTDDALRKMLGGNYPGLVKALVKCLLDERRRPASEPGDDRKRELAPVGKTAGPSGLPVRDPRDIEIERLRADHARLLDELAATTNKKTLYPRSAKNTGNGQCPKCGKREVLKIGTAHGCGVCKHQWTGNDRGDGVPDETKDAAQANTVQAEAVKVETNTPETQVHQSEEIRDTARSGAASLPW